MKNKLRFYTIKSNAEGSHWSMPVYAPSLKELREGLRKIAPTIDYEIKPLFDFDNMAGTLKKVDRISRPFKH